MQNIQPLLFPHTVGDFLTALLVYGGGPVAISYLAFRYLGQKWIESKFAESLENAKHEHAKELQELKRKLDSQLSRTIKLQDQEFDVLREAWDFLQDAEGHVLRLLSIMQSYPDLKCLSVERLEEFLSNSRLTEVHRVEVRQAVDMNKHYQNLIFWYDLHEAKRAYWKYRSHVVKNSIFLRPSLSKLFDAMTNVMWDGLISREIGEEAKDMKMWIEASRKMRAELEPLKLQLQTTVRDVLRGQIMDEESKSELESSQD